MKNTPLLLLSLALCLPACRDKDPVDDTNDTGIPNTDSGLTDCANGGELAFWYGDADGDGFGGMDFVEEACEAPADNYVDNADDCDDLDASVYPGADEYCDGADNDCDGEVDNGALDQGEYFVDSDGDGYGDDNGQVFACEEPDDAVPDGGDCDDADSAINPEAVEICNSGFDENCDGAPTPCEMSAGDADRLFTGETAGARAGVAAGTVGDINGDGADDLVINAYRDSTNGVDAGASYVMYGPVDAGAEVELADADLTFFGGEDMRFGRQMSGGDLDGDGNGDLVVAGLRSTGPHTKSGTVYVFHGPVAAGADVTSDTGFTVVHGENAWDRAGYSAQVIGDFTGDGIDDLAIGAPYHNRDNSTSDSGAVYLVSGGFAQGSYIDLADATARYTGQSPNENVGQTVSSADLDGDGMNELLVGVPASVSSFGAAGAAYVVWGSDAAASTGIEAQEGIFAVEDGYSLGTSIAGVGDVDFDGYEDMLIGATGHDTQDAADAGAALLYLGSATGLAGNDPSAAQAILAGVETDGRAGAAVGGGYFDADDNADLIVGSPQAGSGGSGVAWLVLGQSLSGTYDLGELAEATVVGEFGGDSLGGTVNLQDTNGDGAADLILGAEGSDAADVDAGRAYLVLGIGL